MRSILAVSFFVLVGTAALAAPYHGEPFELEQPDGSSVAVRVWGDEYYQRIEDLGGYTLVRDPDTGIICYAELSADGERFLSTGVTVGDAPPAGLVRGQKLTTEARTAAAWRVRNAFLAEEAAIRAEKSRDPEPSNQGDVLGLTLIIDFSDQVATVPAADFDAYLNQPGYSGYSNNGSVRDYFLDVSGGALAYSNWVPSAYLRAPQPKSYYEDPDVAYGSRARQLVAWALNELNSQGHDFSQYDANDDGYIDAINVFYAGSPSGGWSVGLWPHSSSLSWGADGVSAYKYQITNIGSSLRLSTFCHENGHMIMFWPDLYDYGYESNGVGGFCLMCNSGPGTNPVRPCAYLRAEAGWETPVELMGMQSGLVASHDDMDIFKVSHPDVSNEYYLVENRQRRLRDGAIPDSGLAIWHVDEYGSNNNEQQTPAQHYLVTLVQADGRWDLENDVNSGDSTDLWAAPSYVEFNPSTNPSATWWDGREAPLYIDQIGTSGTTMTYNFREGLGTMSVTVEPLPAELGAAWTLEGPNGYLVEGAGFRSLLVWDEGLYTLTWGDMPGWSEPDPGVLTFDIVDGGAAAQFTGTYGDPPFAALTTGPAADAGPAAAVALVDIDGDGDEDLHVINDGQADLLLRNDGSFTFVDITPAELADTGAGQAAAWSDYDNDGDADVYLVRNGEANSLFEQDAGSFNDMTSLNYGLDAPGSGTDASWVDYDADGMLDLYVVQLGAENLVFRNYGDLGSGYPLLLGASHTTLNNLGPGTAAVWCDYDLDGDRDVYLVNNGSDNLLARSYQGTAFEDASESAMTDDGPGQDAVWGDFDNDGDWDVYTVNDDEDDVYSRWTLGYFSRVFDPVVNGNGPGRSVAAADFDNDGFLDLYIVQDGAADVLLFGDGAGGFLATTAGLPETSGTGATAVCADFDGDGGMDVYLARRGQANVVLRNEVVDRGHWLAVDLRGDPANRDAVGARVRLVSDGISQLREVQAGDGRGQAGQILHFGLGAASSADSVVVTWPGGGEQTVLTGVVGDRQLVVHQNLDTTGVDDEDTPRVTRLQGAYPNPFNPATTIAFELASPGPVTLTVYSLDGRRVVDLLRDELPAGAHEAVWQGRDGAGRSVASGTYLCRLQTRQGAHSTRLTLVK